MAWRSENLFDSASTCALQEACWCEGGRGVEEGGSRGGEKGEIDKALGSLTILPSILFSLDVISSSLELDTTLSSAYRLLVLTRASLISS